MDVRQAADFEREGVGRSELRRLVKDGRLARLRRGAYAEPTDADAFTRHRQLLAATMPQLDDSAVVSHYSAAVLQRIPVPLETLDKVWITRNSAGGGHVEAALHELKTPYRDSDVTVMSGYRVTAPARTAVDIARRSRPEFGVAAADRVLALGVTGADLEEQVGAWPRRRGIARARFAVSLADGRSESFGESWSRLVMWRLGLPAPELQLELRVRGLVYRADFGWPDQGVLGEFDGRVKYGELLRPGQTAADVVMAEKRREADLRGLGWHIVRWDAMTLRNPQRLKELIEAAFRYAAGRPPARLVA